MPLQLSSPKSLEFIKAFLDGLGDFIFSGGKGGSVKITWDF